MVSTMTTNVAQLPARSGDVHPMDDRYSVLACPKAARGITVPRLGVRMWGEVRFVAGYRAAGVHRSAAEGPPV